MEKRGKGGKEDAGTKKGNEETGRDKFHTAIPALLFPIFLVPALLLLLLIMMMMMGLHCTCVFHCFKCRCRKHDEKLFLRLIHRDIITV